MTFTFFDDRFGDRYIISLDDHKDFLHAMRYLDRNPQGEGIEYDRIEDLPPGVRHEIETLLNRRK